MNSLIDVLNDVLSSDLTDKQLASISKISQQAINKYRNGSSKVENMRVENAMRLIDFWEKLNNEYRKQ